jgi:RimJ/RimL family protein N-acetyltransferase
MHSFPPLEPLSDGAVIVRLAAERDIPEVLIAYQDDPQLHMRMGELRPPSGAELGRRAERAEHDRVTGQGLGLTITEPGDDTCAGQIDVHRVDWENERAELGVWVAPARRRRGLASRALRVLGPWLLTAGGLQRVHLLTEPDNAAMIGAARAGGFSYEGVLRGYYRGRGRRVDMAVLSLVRRDVGG